MQKFVLMVKVNFIHKLKFVCLLKTKHTTIQKWKPVTKTIMLHNYETFSHCEAFSYMQQHGWQCESNGRNITYNN